MTRHSNGGGEIRESKDVSVVSSTAVAGEKSFWHGSDEDDTKKMNEDCLKRTGTPYMPDDKSAVRGFEARERFGVSEKPFLATHVYVAQILNFSKKDVFAEKWVLVNDEAQTMSFVNTFDGLTGSGFKIDVATYPLDPKRLRQKVAEHKKVAIDRCPVAVMVEMEEEESNPKAQAAHVGR